MTTDFTARGWMPGADSRQQSPNYTPGRDGQRVEAVCLHVTEGRDSRDWFLSRVSGVSAHFLIRQGQIHQFVSIQDMAWTNGLTWSAAQQTWLDPGNPPRPVRPAWPRLQTFRGNPNKLTVSIEREGYPSEAWPQADIAALITILRYVAQETGLRYIPRDTFIGHFEISPRLRAHCPGPHVEWDAWAALANAIAAQPYRVATATPVYEDRRTTAPIALGGAAWLVPGTVVVVGDVRDGWAWLSSGLGFVELRHLVAPEPGGLLTPASSIIGPPSATLAQCAAYILGRDHGAYTDHDIAGVILPAYYARCAEVGVDPLPLIAQLIHETDNLSSWWAQRPRRNPAGIGVTGRASVAQPATGAWQWNGQDTRWEEGLAFPSWADDAIPAHIGRMLAYALRDDQATAPQRRLINQAFSYRPLPASYRGSAPTLAGLDGRWAVPGHGYAARIAEIANAIRSQ